MNSFFFFFVITYLHLMKHYLFLSIIILFSAPHTFAQKPIAGTNYSHFSLKSKKDTIDFVLADTNLTQKKPIFLFAQGSLPIPLFVDIPGYGNVPITLSNFDLDYMKKYYHVVVISMPKTPVIANARYINSSYICITDSTDENSISEDFLNADYLDNYVNRANAVLKYLSKQSWIDNSKIVVAGHSQGSRIADRLAETNPKITHTGLFGFNPLGRVHEQVWLNYKEALKGNISWDKLDTLQKQQYEFQRVIHDPNEMGPGLTAWRSFTGTTFETLAKIKSPLYIAYGTEDKCAFMNELLPLYFIEAGKTNYEVVRYPNLEHNYFPIVDGRPDYENGKWIEVMNAFVDWTLK